MRKSALLVVLISGVSVSLGRAQAPEKPPDSAQPTPPTTIERFLGSKGQVLRKDFYNAGSLRAIKFDAIVLAEAGGTTILSKGLRITVTEFRASLGPSEHTSFLDVDEVADLSKALAYIADVAAKSKASPQPASSGAATLPVPYSEVAFSTKGDFQIGFYQDGQKQQGFCSSGRLRGGTVFFDVSDFSKLKDIVDRAADVLKQR